jgi:hypothetical protein
MYELTLELASFAPLRVEQELLFRALAERPLEVERFFGVVAGIVPPGSFFGPRHLLRLLGPRGMVKAARGRGRMAA